MSRIICYIPTYSPLCGADTKFPRPYSRLPQNEILDRLTHPTSRIKPWMYFDSIDSVLNIRPDIKLVVADGRSTDEIRAALQEHHVSSGGYSLDFYPERMSQWRLFNDVMNKYASDETEYFVYSSSDVIWHMDWVEEAVKAFEADPKLQILFPLVNKGDGNIPLQVAPYPRDQDPVVPPYDQYGRAPVLNAYAMIFRMEFLRAYGGYMTAFKNCFTESFLSYQCEGMGGLMCLLPRGHVFHWGEGDLWNDNNQGNYNYFAEKPKFDRIMNGVQMARGAGMMTVDLLKQTLYR